jgi:phage/conjugal plasmid C-4 type zinc finger TraR family protein
MEGDGLERFADELDLAQFRIEQATALAIAELRERANSGSGRHTCMDCACRIPPKRLALVPNATRCAACQATQEGRHGKLPTTG